MSETPKQKLPRPNDGKPDADGEDSWGQDQKKHEYYYDDAHGYEVYEPDKDDDEDQAAA
jgi:hypothetical protein